MAAAGLSAITVRTRGAQELIPSTESNRKYNNRPSSITLLRQFYEAQPSLVIQARCHLSNEIKVLFSCMLN